MDYYAAQAQQMRNVPGLSIADANFIDRWEEKARNEDRYYITQQVKQRRDANRAKAAEVLARIDELQDAFITIRKRAERNELPWRDLAKAQRGLVSERIALEKVLESLTATEAANKNMEADPTAYLSSFYSRFPTLNDRRPNLAVALAEDQRKRGVESLF